LKMSFDHCAGRRSSNASAFRPDDAIRAATARASAGVGRRGEPAEHVARAREPQAVRVDRVHVLARWVVGPELDVVELREVRGEQRADGTATDYAHLHE